MYYTGDLVRITDRKCGHQFELGEVVELTSVEPTLIRAHSLTGDAGWAVTKAEIELVNDDEEIEAAIASIRRAQP